MSSEENFQNCYKASCRVQAAEAGGSCTIIYSKDNESYALTNFHVIEKSLEYKEVWSNLLQKKVTKEYTKAVEVLYPVLDEDDEVSTWSSTLADVVLHDKEQDIALLKLRDKIFHEHPKFYPREIVKKIKRRTKLVMIGCPLGEKPITTDGRLNGKGIEMDNFEYWLTTAQIAYGNSGGGMFVEKDEDWFFLGIPSMVAVVPMGFGATDAITHMGYFIPLNRIYDFLEENCYQFIYDNEFTVEMCNELRANKREESFVKELLKKKL